MSLVCTVGENSILTITIWKRSKTAEKEHPKAGQNSQLSTEVLTHFVIDSTIPG